MLNLEEEEEEIEEKEKKEESENFKVNKNNVNEINEEEKIIISIDEKKNVKGKEESESTDSIEEIDKIFSSLNLNNIKHQIKNERKDIKEKENIIEQNMVEEGKKENIQNKMLNLGDFIIKTIEADGNCFYRTISYFFRNTEKDYKEFRELIVRYIENNPQEYIYYVPDEDINILENEEEFDIFNKKREYILDYAQNAKQDGTFAGDIEIATTAHYLGVNINILVRGELNYKSYLFYEGIIKTEETINILYDSNNHFILLIKIQKNDNILEENNKEVKKHY